MACNALNDLLPTRLLTLISCSACPCSLYCCHGGWDLHLTHVKPFLVCRPLCLHFLLPCTLFPGLISQCWSVFRSLLEIFSCRFPDLTYPSQNLDNITPLVTFRALIHYVTFYVSYVCFFPAIKYKFYQGKRPHSKFNMTPGYIILLFSWFCSPSICLELCLFYICIIFVG